MERIIITALKSLQVMREEIDRLERKLRSRAKWYEKQKYNKNRKGFLAKHKKWASENREKIRTYEKEYRKRPKVKKKIREASRKYMRHYIKRDYVKKRMSKYYSKYAQRSEVKKRRNAQENERYAIKRLDKKHVERQNRLARERYHKNKEKILARQKKRLIQNKKLKGGNQVNVR